MSILVEASGPDPRGLKASSQAFHSSADGRARFSASGFIWACTGLEATVLGPASFLSPFLRKRHDKAAPELLPYTRLAGEYDGEHLILSLLGIFELPKLRSAVEELCSEGPWAWAWNLKDGLLQPRYEYDNATIAVLGCKLRAEASKKLHSLEKLAHSAPQQGSWLFCKGAPFGCLAPSHFQGYHTRGTVANAPIQGSPMFLMDMHGLPGMEGAPMIDAEGSLQGMLSQPLSHSKFDAEVAIVITACCLQEGYESWLRGQDLNFAPLASESSRTAPKVEELPGLTPGMSAQQQIKGTDAIRISPAAGQSKAHSVRDAAQSVVAVVSGNSWASGVIASSHGLILTVAHALEDSRKQHHAPLTRTPLDADHVNGQQPSSDHQRWGSQRPFAFSVKVGIRDSQGQLIWAEAEVVYCFNQVLDLAVLRIQVPKGLQLRPAKLFTGEPKIGEAAFVVGYGLFSPQQQALPSMSCGIVSKAMRTAGRDVMILTDAAIYPGASGGALFLSTGELLGLVTSNTRHASSGRSFARLNYSIAANSLREVWQLLKGGELAAPHFSALDVESAELSAAWALRAPPSVLTAERPEKPLDRFSRMVKRTGLDFHRSKPVSKL